MHSLATPSSEYYRHPLILDARDSYSDVYANIFQEEPTTYQNPQFSQEYSLEAYSGSQQVAFPSEELGANAEVHDGFAITIISQTTFFLFLPSYSCSLERLFYIPHLLARWKGNGMNASLIPRPISIAVFVDVAELPRIHSFIQSSSFPSRLLLTLYIALNQSHDCAMFRGYFGRLSCKQQFIYPINRLRNLAIKRVETSHFLMLDMDTWPSGEQRRGSLICSHFV